MTLKLDCFLIDVVFNTALRWFVWIWLQNFSKIVLTLKIMVFDDLIRNVCPLKKFNTIRTRISTITTFIRSCQSTEKILKSGYYPRSRRGVFGRFKIKRLMTSMAYPFLEDLFFSISLSIVVLGELVMRSDDLFSFRVTILTSDFLIVEIVIMCRARFDGDFDYISFLDFLFYFIEVCLSVSISIFDWLHFL